MWYTIFCDLIPQILFDVSITFVVQTYPHARIKAITISDRRSYIYYKRRGPHTEPCGTPVLKLCWQCMY